MIRSLVGRFEELSSVAYRPGRGAHRNIYSEDSVETVQQSVADDPSVSTRCRSSQLGISRTTLGRILKFDLRCTHTKLKLCKHCYRQTPNNDYNTLFVLHNYPHKLIFK
ncbi:hypothetical protein TNCT_180401 [Trichonephila clavata]|uniref:Uncharacterized protein n=1 Tax=Trichonephila clavata TaxID=2740835 RepID=A0A8X6IRY5_TRICU|nr:hypothetical protein TNCT_180401 [Trichonephila clavata]